MNLYSSDLSILVNKIDGCYYDLKINPAFGTGGSSGPVSVAGSPSLLLQGNGTTIPIQGDVKISADPTNALTLLSDGLMVSIPESAYGDEEAREALSGTSPIVYNSSTGNISVNTANSVQSGVLSSADWSSFNAKVTTASNIGSGVEVFKQKTGSTLELRRLSAGTGINIGLSGDSILISSSVSDFTTADARAAISASLPLQYNNTTGVVSLPTAGPSASGALSSTDWVLFNNKVSQTRIITTTAPLTGGGNLGADLNIGITRSSLGTNGYLHQEDFTVFAAKQDPITWQNVTAGSSKITLGGTPTASVKNPFSIDVNESNLNRANMIGVTPITGGGTGASTATQALLNLVPSVTGNGGKVLGTDGINLSWVTGGGGTGGENPLTFNSPLTRVGDTVGIVLADSTHDGYLSASNWNSFSNKVNDAQNIGTTSGADVFSAKVGTNLQFRRLLAGTNMVVVENGDDIIFSSTAGVGGSAHAVNTTVAELKGNSSPQTALPYYITDDGQQGFFIYSASSSAADNGGGLNNSGTVIVSANGRRFLRVYGGRLDIRWFGGKADYAPSGTTMTGTNNTPALNRALNVAGDNQQVYIPYGNWYFATAPDVLDNSKKRNLYIDGDTYHNGVNFFKIKASTLMLHKFVHKGNAIGKLGIPSHSRTTYTNGTGPDWDSFTGDFVTVEDAAKVDAEMNFVDGFRAAIRVAGGDPIQEGGQENRFKFKWLKENKYGILLQSIDGSSYTDKGLFFGGRIGGQRAIYFDGNMSGGSPTGVFTHNQFFNILIELADYGITGTGVIRYNKWIGCAIEGGFSTGIMSGEDINLPTSAIGNTFNGHGIVGLDQWANPGNMTNGYGTNYISSTGRIMATAAVGSTAPGRVTIMGSVNGMNLGDLGTIPSHIDYIELLPSHNIPQENRTGDFCRVRWNGENQTVRFSGKYVNVDSAGTTTLIPPTGWVRLAAGNGAVTLAIESTDVFNGQNFYIEQTGTGTVEIRRASDNAQLMPTTSITSTGIYLVRAVSASFTATKLGGGGGVGDVTSIETSSSANQLVLMSDSSGKSIKKGTGSGYVKATSGLISYVAAIPVSDLQTTGTPASNTFLNGLGQWTILGGSGGDYIFGSGLSESGGIVTNNLITGIAGNQTVTGSVTASGDLILRSTTSSTKGQIVTQDTLLIRANTTSANTAPLKWTKPSSTLPNIMTIQEDGAWEWDGTDWWATNLSHGRRKLLTDSTVAVLNNMTWNGAPITYNLGGRDLWEDGTPTFTVSTGAGTGGSVTKLTGSTNGQGQITINVGSSPASSAVVVTCNFGGGGTTGKTPIVTITAANAVTALDLTNVWVVTTSTSSFTLRCASPLLAGGVYTFNYMTRRTGNAT